MHSVQANLIDPRLEAAVLRALRPSGAGDTLRMAAMGGFSLPQVLDRVPSSVALELTKNPDNPILARRDGIAALVLVLNALEDQGRVRRGRVRMKNALVDSWRLSLRALAREGIGG
jgi:hypothetical protein